MPRWYRAATVCSGSVERVVVKNEKTFDKTSSGYALTENKNKKKTVVQKMFDRCSVPVPESQFKTSIPLKSHHSKDAQLHFSVYLKKKKREEPNRDGFSSLFGFQLMLMLCWI